MKINHRLIRRSIAAALLLAALLGLSCEAVKEPDYTKLIYVKGTPYERGFQIGERHESTIKSLFTRLLTTSIVPYLNREQMSIAPVLTVYLRPEFMDGKFSYQMLLESGQKLEEEFLPESVIEEMHGIADGSGLPYDDVLVLNTFFDTMMGFRAIVNFIQGIQTPYVVGLGFKGAAESDGADNDDDGETDEEGEGWTDAYESSPNATFLEIPADSTFEIVLADPELAGASCIDPRNVEPFADKGMDPACVNMDCVLDANKNDRSIYRESMNDVALECLVPRVARECLVDECVQSLDPGLVNPCSIRIQMNTTQFEVPEGCDPENLPADGCLLKADDGGCIFQMEEFEGEKRTHLSVRFTPPGGFPKAETVALLIQVGDQSPIYSPEPYHNRYMRDERLVFTTAGFAKKHGTGDKLYEVPNKGERNNRAQPPSIAFGARNTATPDGNPILAHHYALLDSDMVHEHSLIVVEEPEDGHPFAILTWAGVVWGFAGMNDTGLSYAINNSDTLDNPLVGHALLEILNPDNLRKLLLNPNLIGLAEVLAEVRLQVTGMPVGIMMREALRRFSKVEEGRDYIYELPQSYGWNILLADADGGLMGLEVDGAVQSTEEVALPAEDRDGFYSYTPDPDDPLNRDAFGRMYASVGPDDLFMASHNQKNLKDIGDNSIMQNLSPGTQREWSGFYFRSLRSYYLLGEEIEKRQGSIDVDTAIEILRTPDLVDTRDSMLAVVFEPARGILHWAMGGIPATDQPFVPLDLKAAVKRGGLEKEDAQ